MYTRQELSKLKQDFWTRFGQYMQPITSAAGEKINWVNYKTGVPFIRFVMDADVNRAIIAIELSHPDEAQREKDFQHFKNMKAMLEAVNGEWLWQETYIDEYDKKISRIYSEVVNVNIARHEDWAQIISFLKPKIIGLDKFWADARDIFETLR